MKQSRHYIRNADLLREVIRYKETEVFSEELGAMLLTIARNYASKGSYSGYTWVPDMVSEAVLTCVKYLKNFNPEKSTNAFAYVTQICKNSFKAFIKDQHKHKDIKDLCYKSYTKFIESQKAYTLSGINYENVLDPFRSEDEEKFNKPH